MCAPSTTLASVSAFADCFLILNRQSSLTFNQHLPPATLLDLAYLFTPRALAAPLLYLRRVPAPSACARRVQPHLPFVCCCRFLLVASHHDTSDVLPPL